MSPLLYETIGQSFDRAAVKYAHCDALIVPQQACSLDVRGIEGARGYACRRVPRPRTRTWRTHRHLGAECAEWTLTQFATAKAGLILVNINPAYRLTELEYALNKVGLQKHS